MEGTKIIIVENNSRHLKCIQEICNALTLEYHPQDKYTSECIRGDYCLALEEGVLKEVRDSARTTIATQIAEFIGRDIETVIFIISDQLKYRAEDVTGIQYYNTFVKDFYPHAYVLFVSDFLLRKNDDQLEVLKTFCEETPQCELMGTSKDYGIFEDMLALTLKRIQVRQRVTP